MQLTLIAKVESITSHQLCLPSGYTIERMRESNSQALAELYLASYPSSIVEDMDAALQEIRETFAHEFGHLRTDLSPVVIKDNTIVATVMTVDEAPWPDTPPGLFLIEVITHPRHQRCGLAQSNLVWVAMQAQNQGHNTLALRVESDNGSAMALYRKLGFREWVP